jgi:hypothetical protein
MKTGSLTARPVGSLPNIHLNLAFISAASARKYHHGWLFSWG